MFDIKFGRVLYLVIPLLILLVKSENTYSYEAVQGSGESEYMFSCNTQSSEECCDQLFEDADIRDIRACREAFSFRSYQRIKKISAQTIHLGSNAMEMSGSGGGIGEEASFCDTMENCTLYILESASDTASEPRKYMIPRDFELPVNSGWVSNSMDENSIPEIIVEQSGTYDYVMTARNSASHYQLKNIKINSRGEYPPLGVLDPRGAGLVSIEGVKIIRDPVKKRPGGDASTIHAIRLGCSNGGLSEYRISNSVIDLTRSLERSTEFSSGLSYYTGAAIHFSHCTGQTRLLFNGSDVLIGYRQSMDLQTQTRDPNTGALLDLNELADSSESAVEIMGSGLNLLYCMNINAKFDFINQQANDNVVHLF